jgi:hypothetical protein
MSQLNPERTYLHPQVVFRMIAQGEPVPLGEGGEQRWAVPNAITMVEEDDRDDGHGTSLALELDDFALPGNG